MNPSGAAAKHGKIQEGDRVLKVGDIFLRGLENMEAASVLRNSRNPVKLVLSRRKNPQPSQESKCLREAYATLW
jgi:C-terminal processing protease CtpA/Prc